MHNERTEEKRNEMEKNIAILVTFCLYLLGMLAIGGYFYFKTKNLEDYILGGRKLGNEINLGWVILIVLS